MRILAGTAAVVAACALLAPAVPAAASTSGSTTTGSTTRHSALPRSIPRTSTATERSLLASGKPHGVGELYALNDLTHHVVRFDLRAGRWQTSLIGTGWVDPSALAVTRKGVAWVIDSGTHQLVRVARGGAQRSIRTVDDPSDASLVTDPSGNAYYNDHNQVIKVSRSGGTVTLLGSVQPTGPSPIGLGVDAAGRPTVAYLTGDVDGPDGTSDVAFATFPTEGGTPTIRQVDLLSIDSDYGVYDFREGSTGAIVVHEFAGLGSGYTGLLRFDPGSSTATDPTTKLAASEAAFDSRGLLYVMETRKFCLNPQLGEGCVPNDSIDRVIVYPAAGGTAYGTIPTSNLTLPNEISADTRGRIFASGSAGLQTIPPGGGPAYPILRGSFFALQSPPGK